MQAASDCVPSTGYDNRWSERNWNLKGVWKGEMLACSLPPPSSLLPPPPSLLPPPSSPTPFSVWVSVWVWCVLVYWNQWSGGTSKDILLRKIVCPHTPADYLKALWIQRDCKGETRERLGWLQLLCALFFFCFNILLSSLRVFFINNIYLVFIWLIFHLFTIISFPLCKNMWIFFLSYLNYLYYSPFVCRVFIAGIIVSKNEDLFQCKIYIISRKNWESSAEKFNDE